MYDWSSANARDLVRFGGAEEFSQLGYARELRAILTDRFRLYFGNFRIWWYLVFVHCSLLPVEVYIHGNRNKLDLVQYVIVEV